MTNMHCSKKRNILVAQERRSISFIIIQAQTQGSSEAYAINMSKKESGKNILKYIPET
jgi:hypothetical protein